MSKTNLLLLMNLENQKKIVGRKPVTAMIPKFFTRHDPFLDNYLEEIRYQL